MIEHDMDTALDLAETVTLLNYGRVIVDGERDAVIEMNEPARCILAPDALSLTNVHAYYGDSHILHGVSFSLPPGGVLALLGRNGAGKTTCISTIIGFLRPRQGRYPPVRRADRRPRSRAYFAFGNRSCPPGPPYLRLAHGSGKSGRGPATRRRQRNTMERRTDLRAVSAIARTPRATGRHALGR